MLPWLSSSLSCCQLALLQHPPARFLRPAHEIQVVEHAGELVHGQRLARIRPRSLGSQAVEVGNDEIGRSLVMDEMAAHPFDGRRPARGDGGVRSPRLIWRPSAPRRPDRRRLARRIEDGQRQQAEVDADGGEQRDQVAAR